MSKIKHGNWGGFPLVRGNQLETSSLDELKHLSQRQKEVIARGNGRSYGDAGLGETMLHYDARDISGFEDGIVEVESGITIGVLMNYLIPKGYILPVLPGHTQVSIGGAIASDIHGKNHHIDGSFSNFVLSFNLLTSSGEVIKCSKHENSTIFRATFGAMGLTGIILATRIRCLKIDSSLIETRKVKSRDLDSLIQNFENYSDHHYSVAWLDLSYPRKQSLNAILSVGNHAVTTRFENRSVDYSRLGFKLPVQSPLNLVTPVSRTFNYVYYRLNKEGTSLIDLQQFFFPLDRIQNWNTLYGTKGVLSVPDGCTGLVFSFCL